MNGVGRWLPGLGRVFLSLIFFVTCYGDITGWGRSTAYMASKGIPAASILLGGAVALKLIGSLSLILGLKVRFGAIVLMLFLIPTTLIMHDFWMAAGADREMQLTEFLKNVGLLGGLFQVIAFGSGPPASPVRSPRR